MASPTHPITGAPPPPAETQPTLPDDLLEDIFLRLPTAADLARACTVCASFRRVIADPFFLRRFPFPRPPPLLGFLCAHFHPHFHPAQPPHPSASAASALAHAADFTFSFLPNPSRWSPLDVRDGRVLLSSVSISEGCGNFTDTRFTDLVVCDPLYRRYLRIPPIPEDLAASVRHCGMLDFEPFLAPAGEGEKELSFRVICRVLCESKLVAFVFSSGTATWCGGVPFHGSSAWTDAAGSLFRRHRLLQRHCAHGRFYWVLVKMDKMLMLDTRGMEFFIVDLPRDSHKREHAIVEAEEGRLGLFTLGASTLSLYCKSGAGEWWLDKIIPFLPGYYLSIIGAAQGYLLLCGIPVDRFQISSQQMPEIEYFALELKGLLLKRLCVLSRSVTHALLYTGFPPPLSPPSV